MKEIVTKWACFLTVLKVFRYWSLGGFFMQQLKNQFRIIPTYGKKLVTIRLEIIMLP